MKISSRGRYGIRLLIDLAENFDKPHVSLARVAERKAIPVRYLEQVAMTLRQNGFIRSVKGASGGYTLAKPPEEIKIGDALRALEGDMLVVDPPLRGSRESGLQRCIRIAVYERLNECIAELIDRQTLASITGRHDPGESTVSFI